MNQPDLISCEQEPLNLSGHIQPHGALVMLDGDARITHVSSNARDWLGPAFQVGRPLAPQLSDAWLQLGVEPGSRVLRLGVMASPLAAAGQAAPGTAPTPLLDLAISRGEAGVAALEVFAARGGPAQAAPAQALDDATLTPFCSEQALQQHRQALVEQVAQITGFQRVMYYAFQDDGDGEVIAETRRGEAFGSYLGLRFPAHDIPQIARQLYLKNPWRLIPDAQARPIAVVGAAGAPPPDLTWSDLRSVSPVHCAYLDNMRVRASLSFPVVVGGQLTALVAAHHEDPTVLALGSCAAASQRVHRHALRLTSHQAHQRLRLLDSVGRQFDGVGQILMRHGVLDAAALGELAPIICEALHAHGVCIVGASPAPLSWGQALEDPALTHLDAWLMSRGDGGPVWQSDCLRRDVPGMPLSAVHGVTAIRASRPGHAPLRVYLSRGESIYEVRWGGQPQTPHERADGVLDIRPRRSFETWVERRLGHSRAWDNASRLLALRLREVLLAHRPQGAAHPG